MPYITQENRDRLEDEISMGDFGFLCYSPGELNYLIIKSI